jgi:hypothetical protein
MWAGTRSSWRFAEYPIERRRHNKNWIGTENHHIAGSDSRFTRNRRSSNPASGRHNPEFRTSRRQLVFCNTLARGKRGRHWTFPQTADGGCTQLPGSVSRGQNSMCSATGRLVFPRELHTEPVWTEVSETVSSAVRLGYTPNSHSSLTLFTSI